MPTSFGNLKGDVFFIKITINKHYTHTFTHTHIYTHKCIYMVPSRSRVRIMGAASFLPNSSLPGLQ